MVVYYHSLLYYVFLELKFREEEDKDKQHLRFLYHTFCSLHVIAKHEIKHLC